ncbi:MAG TPA: BadF/BadG/BcrA/BcrD ATPase family protein [Candidatus Cybelea sp.]|jgi:N-acetylglucosamine kinase-like BadF-type ATPase
MSRLFAGIDGGQSSTVAAIADETGRILARGRAGPADEIGVGASSTRLHDALHAALGDACARAGLGPQSEFAGIVAGVSGYEGRVYGRKPEFRAQRFTLLHDAPIAHAGALAGAPGVVAIAGTGSVVYARDERGSERTFGGWGPLFGDEGSGFGIVREGLAGVMQGHDAGLRQRESAAACAFFGVRTLRELSRAIYAGEITRDKLASFAPAALAFPFFRRIARRGADRLAGLIRTAAEPIARPNISLLGGLFADPPFRERVSRRVLELVPAARIVDPRYEPALGALLLAYREIGRPIPELSE